MAELSDLAASCRSPAPSSRTTRRGRATGGWRTGERPTVDLSRCVNCLLCWLYCPDSAIVLDGDDVHGLRSRLLQGLRDLRRGLPVDAIEMVAE